MSHIKVLSRQELFLLDLLAASVNDCSLNNICGDELTKEEWINLIEIASLQGVAAIICSQIEKLP